MSDEAPGAAVVFSRENTLALRGVILASGAVWFVATDALALMQCANSPNAMKRFQADEWRQIGACNPFGLHPHARVISERALGKLALYGRKPEAASAAEWLIHHVIPTTYTLRPGALAGARS